MMYRGRRRGKWRRFAACPLRTVRLLCVVWSIVGPWSRQWGVKSEACGSVFVVVFVYVIWL